MSSCTSNCRDDDVYIYINVIHSSIDTIPELQQHEIIQREECHGFEGEQNSSKRELTILQNAQAVK